MVAKMSAFGQQQSINAHANCQNAASKLCVDC